MKKNILVGQSGGPTAVINASLYGVIAEGMARPEDVDHVYGMVNGIEGFLSGHVMDLSSLTHEDLILLKQTPAAYLAHAGSNCLKTWMRRFTAFYLKNSNP